MPAPRRLGATLLGAAAVGLQLVAAQDPTPYTDPDTKIQFGTWSVVDTQNDPDSYKMGGFTFGMALPENALTTDATEYIGILKCVTTANTTGWCGVSHGESGQMSQSLLLVAYPYEGQVMTSFRYATGYSMPGPYRGDAKLTQISSKVTETEYEVIYRCQNCFSWTVNGAAGHVSSKSGLFVLGRAQGAGAVKGGGCPDSITFGFHDLGFGQYGANLTSLPSASYSDWAALATKTPATTCAAAPPATSPTAPATPGEPTAAPEAPKVQCKDIPKNVRWDYVIAGAGAGGIPIADRLSEAGYSVLLIEKGPPSTGRWGGNMGPEWLDGTGLTRFDVPGLCNEIWHDSTGVACTDMDQMAGCVLGGGTAVNAGLWWKPNPRDWDYNFPYGWKSGDTAGATRRVFSRISGTQVPSMDGKLYRQEGFNVLAKGLDQAGWKFLDGANNYPDEKNHTFSHTTYMFSGGERGGPLATYLVSANNRRLFTLWTNTNVRKIVREGGHATGVEVEATADGGYCGTVPLSSYYGRVIVSAGTFGSAKLLMRSGIGPLDQLEIVKASSDGPTMIADEQWIDLPVGYNLVDHVNTDTIVAHPDVVFYDFYEAWDNPIVSDQQAYLNKRAGILAQAAPNIGPMMWEEIKGDDGITRSLQWTCRVEGVTNTSMTMSLYLGRGSTGRGRMVITPSLDTRVAVPPYLHDDNDKAAIIKGIESIQRALSGVQNLTWQVPPSNQSVTDYVNSLPPTPGPRRANHWMGTAKMGFDDGRAGGTAVVDTNAKVYGTDNIFVVDASIFPGMVTGNPSAMIVIASEFASNRIINLPYPSAGRYGAQCGGVSWRGSFTCREGLTCTKRNENLSVCQ